MGCRADERSIIRRKRKFTYGGLRKLIRPTRAFLNPNIVKVVMDANGNALYFSRSPIPYPRDDAHKANIQAHRHIGIYAYRVGFLKQYAQLAATDLEKTESLEQLRVLYHGYKIGVTITQNAPVSGVDTQEDLDFVRSTFKDKEKL